MYPTYYGCEIKPSKTADKEMVNLKIYLDDVLRILEEGKDASRSKRKKGTIEKSLRIRGKMVKVVVVESMTRWSNEKVWLIIHVGEIHEK
ncbi:MAG: hypothetical protein JSV49_11335 [Thermoplasmata archaeon]|nr:MAG: hypothetical protein JSV49_11335 [Thermoplasmata archaeon]